MPDRNPTLWPLEPHTGAKHSILRRYLGAWFPKLARWNRRVVFIDGFAGPGEYLGGEPGSPIIALDAAISHRHDLSGCELVYLFVEERRDRYQHLKELVDGLQKPKNVRADVLCSTFDRAMAALVENLGGKALAPTFVMIDPFGVKGVAYDVVKSLAGYQRAELLISFMYESITRFLTTPEFEPHLDAMFGTPDWRQALEMDAVERRRFLPALYVTQLKAAGMEYPRTFEMKDAGRRTEYFLIFATHSIEGLKAMKDAMWAADPSGRFQFSDATNPDQPTLFGAEPDFAQLRDLILVRFGGQLASIEEIERFVLIETPFRETHLKRPILRPMEIANEIDIELKRERRLTYPAGTLIRFRPR